MNINCVSWNLILFVTFRNIMWADAKLHFPLLPLDYELYHPREYNHFCPWSNGCFRQNKPTMGFMTCLLRLFFFKWETSWFWGETGSFHGRNHIDRAYQDSWGNSGSIEIFFFVTKSLNIGLIQFMLNFISKALAEKNIGCRNLKSVSPKCLGWKE